MGSDGNATRLLLDLAPAGSISFISRVVFVVAPLPAGRLPLRDMLQRNQDLAVIARVVLELLQESGFKGLRIRIALSTGRRTFSTTKYD